MGENGTILTYDGVQWSKMNSSTLEHLYGVWGTSEENIYAVGAAGTILHYNGVIWSNNIQSGTTNDLRAIWGSAANDIYVVGDKGTVVHFDGANWSKRDGATTAWLLGAWGTADNNIYAVGGYYDGVGNWWDRNAWDGGVILHYDGVDWSEIKSDIPNRLFSIWGSSVSNIYAVGAQATILHYTDNGSDNTCIFTNLFGEHSQEVARMRIFRDDKLIKTAGGRMAVKLYYLLSPLMVKIVDFDQGVRATITTLIDRVLHWGVQRD